MTRQHTVDHQLNKFKRSSWGGHIAVVVDVATIDCDACLVGVILARADLTHYPCVANVFPFFIRDVLVADDAEGVGTFDPLLLGSCGSLANTLAKPPQLISIRVLPYIFVFEVVSELSILKGFTSFLVKDWHRRQIG